MYLESPGEFHDEFTFSTSAIVCMGEPPMAQAENLESVFHLANQIYVFLLTTLCSVQVS